MIVTIVVGIVSFGERLGCTVGWPQGFTKVGSYLDWIGQRTGIALRN